MEVAFLRRRQCLCKSSCNYTDTQRPPTNTLLGLPAIICIYFAWKRWKRVRTGLGAGLDQLLLTLTAADDMRQEVPIKGTQALL